MAYRAILLMAGLTFIAPMVQADNRFAVEIVPDIVNGEVVNGFDSSATYVDCSSVFVMKKDGGWGMSPTTDLTNPNVERIEVCLRSRNNNATLDVLKASSTLDANVRGDRSHGYGHINSALSKGLFSMSSKNISVDKLNTVLQSEEVKAATPRIMENIYKRLFNRAIKGDEYFIRKVLVQMHAFVSDDEDRELLFAYGTSTGSKEFPQDLLTHSKPEIVSAAKQKIEKAYQEAYRKQVSALLTNEEKDVDFDRKISELQKKITTLSAVDKKFWFQEDFDNKVPELKTMLAAYEKKRDLKNSQADSMTPRFPTPRRMIQPNTNPPQEQHTPAQPVTGRKSDQDRLRDLTCARKRSALGLPSAMTAEEQAASYAALCGN